MNATGRLKETHAAFDGEEMTGGKLYVRAIVIAMVEIAALLCSSQ
jgi:hypothetical protein